MLDCNLYYGNHMYHRRITTYEGKEEDLHILWRQIFSIYELHTSFIYQKYVHANTMLEYRKKNNN